VSETHDVLIVGAGPAGSGLAYFLAQQGRDVLLIDKADFPRDKTCGDGLTPRALGVLRTMRVLDQVTAVGHRVNGIHIYALDGQRIASPIPAWRDLPQHVLVVPRYRLDDVLRRHAVAAGAEFRPHTEATGLLREGEQVIGVEVRTPAGPQTLRARQTVLATGASMGLLERTGLLPVQPHFGRAARGYYEGLTGLPDAIEFHLDSIPRPGYGWVFPISPTAANVGVGYFTPPGQKPLHASPREALATLLAQPAVASRMGQAQLEGPIRGYPLRFDFPQARLAWPGLLLTGEAAGLVNPLTGEGIDYALEAAEVAAETLTHTRYAGTAPVQVAQAYTRAMHARFLRAFVAITRLRDVYFKSWLFDKAVRAALRYDDFLETFVQVCLGNLAPAQGLSPRRLLQIALS
jgi:geranylgeranyl reductase family protein